MWCPGSGEVFDCIDSLSLPSFFTFTRGDNNHAIFEMTWLVKEQLRLYDLDMIFHEQLQMYSTGICTSPNVTNIEG